MQTFRFNNLSWRARASYLTHLFKAVSQQHHAWMRPLFGRFLDPGGVVIDIGGHSGQYTKLLAAIVTRGRVYTFEPSSYSMSILRRVVGLRRLANVSLIAKGLSDAPGSLVLSTPLKPAGTFRFGVAHMGGQDDGKATARFREMVEVTTLDAFAAEVGLPRLDLIKIDVEGWEMRVLEGGSDTIRRFRPVIYLELVERLLARAGDSLESAWGLLASWGYRPFVCLDGKDLTPRDAPVDGDTFWLPE